MSDIPPEIITDILSRLPVKSLLRFRCVSKSLKATIDNPYFIKTHLRRQTLKPNSDLKLVLKEDTLLSIDFHSIGSSQPQEVDDPLKLSKGLTQVIGSCHGLLLIYNSNSLCLWNPSTKMFWKLPVCDIKHPQVMGPNMIQVGRGFGYDSSSDDYKVVQLAQWLMFDDGCDVSQFMIYSLKLDLWRKVEDCPYWLYKECNGELAGGVLHWLALKKGCGRCILGLNLSNEKFQLLPYPENIRGPLELNLAVLGECLCLLSVHANDDTFVNSHVFDQIDIWVMKDYGVRQSWIKLFSVGRVDGVENVRYLRPISYSETGMEVLLQIGNKRLLWYNLEEHSLKDAMVCGELKYFQSFVCLGTLVPLSGGCNGSSKEKNIDHKRGRGRNLKRGDGFLSKGFKLRL